MLTMLASLMCLPPCEAAGEADLPTLDEAAPVEQAQVDRYDLTAAYEPSLAGQIALILEREDDRNFLFLRANAKRTEIVRVADGRSTRMAAGAGAKLTGGCGVTVRRRPGTLAVFSGDRALVEAYVDFRPGACGSVAGAGVLRPTDLRLQEIGAIVLDDDFFVGEPREGLWENLLGAFRIDIYWDPKQRADNRPIGACWLANDGPGEHLAATGTDFWDDYACEVSARPDANSTVGLAFRVRDRANYALLALACERPVSIARLIEVRDSTVRTLAETPGYWPAGHWQRLRVEVVGSRASGFVSGQPVGGGELTALPSGRVGVYSKTECDCRFDDLSVRGVRRITPQLRAQPAGPWRFARGAWQGKGGQLTCRAASTAVAVAAVGAWADADVRATLRLPATGEAGVLARWSTDGGYAFLTQRTGGGLLCRLARVGADGLLETLSEAPAPATAGGQALGLTVSGPALRGFVNGTCVARAWDGRLASGEVGVIASGGQAQFTDFSAGEPRPEDVISELLADGTDQSRPGAEHGVFEPFIGDLWRPEAGGAGLTTLDGEPAIALNRATLRYYSPRPGDALLSIDLLRTDGQAVSLTICSGATLKQGYTLTLKGAVLELSRNGQPVAEAPMPTATPLPLSLRRDGPFVIGQAGRAVLTYHDPEPLPSGDALVSAGGQAVIDNLHLGAAHALAYRFDRVEPDWIETSGEWLFHSGMACIPWAYWLSGDGRETPAVVWHRRQAPADVTVRFDVSEYTVGHESGDHEHFPYHDISLVLSGDGEHLDSGYRFLVGAQGGTQTRLLRRGQVVAETRDSRFSITMESHCNSPRAIEVVATKKGGLLTLWLNGAQALTYEDPEPLGAGRVALGIANCRANFRDLFLYRDMTWTQPLGVTAFSPEPTQ